MYGVVIFLWGYGGGGCGSPKIQRKFLSTLNMGMSHRKGSELFVFVWGAGGGGGRGGRLTLIKYCIHIISIYMYHTDTLRLNCRKVLFL